MNNDTMATMMNLLSRLYEEMAQIQMRQANPKNHDERIWLDAYASATRFSIDLIKTEIENSRKG